MSAPAWLLVDSGPNPSTDFFVAPQLMKLGAQVTPMRWYHPPSAEPEQGTNVVFVRYVSKPWLQWVMRYRQRLGRVVYFMDDDLLDHRAWAGQRWRYQWRLFQKAYRHKQAILKCMTDLWVSSPVMAKKYRYLPVTRIAPVSPYLTEAPGQNLSGENSQAPVVFYHGSASHEAELIWLKSVCRIILNEHPTVQFELIADDRLRKHYVSLKQQFPSRLNLIHPMPWPDYKQFITQPGRTVGLAPLLPLPFNEARSPTKVFDIRAAGALGIYADTEVYAELVEARCEGKRVPMDESQWVDAILDSLKS